MRQVYQILNQPSGSHCPHAEGFHKYVPCNADELPPCFTSPDFPAQWAAELKKEKVAEDELAAARTTMAGWKKKGIIGDASLPEKLARETKRVDERGNLLQKEQEKEKDERNGELQWEKKAGVLKKQMKEKDDRLKDAVRKQIALEIDEEKLKNSVAATKKKIVQHEQKLEREEHAAVLGKKKDDVEIEKMKESVKAHMSVIKNQAKRTAYWKNKFSKSGVNEVNAKKYSATIQRDKTLLRKDKTAAQIAQMKLHAMTERYHQEQGYDAKAREAKTAQKKLDDIQIQKLNSELKAPAFLARKEAYLQAKQVDIVDSIRAHGGATATDIARMKAVASRFSGHTKQAESSTIAKTSFPATPTPAAHLMHSRLKHQVGCGTTTTWNLSPDTHQCQATKNNAVGVMVGHYKKSSMSGSIEQCQDACCSSHLCGGFKFISSGCSSSADVACSKPGVCSFLVETLTLGSAPFKVGQGSGGCLVFSRSRGR
jgi:hypothetical protein